MNDTITIISLIVVLVSLGTAVIIGYVRYINMKRLADYFKSDLEHILGNDNLIDESVNLVCMTYNVERDDLMKFISTKQKEDKR